MRKTPLLLISGFMGLGLNLPALLPVQTQSRSLAPQEAPNGSPATPTIVPEATAAARLAHRQEQIDRIALSRYDLQQYPLTDANETHWRKTFWATAVLEPQDAAVMAALQGILAQAFDPNLSPAQMRTIELALRVSNQFYLQDPDRFPELKAALQEIHQKSLNAEWVALALATLVRGSTQPDDRYQLIEQTQTRFPHWITLVPLYTTLQDLKQLDSPSPLPPLADLLTWQIVPQELHLYVFCRPDRGIPCRTLLKNTRGEFVGESRENGAESDNEEVLWSVLLSGRSLHNLSWQFSHGETPQGIYRIEGTIPQPDTDFFYAYGLFPLVNLFVPLEPEVKAFVPLKKGTLQGGLPAYWQLLPPTWQRYFPIEESYWAGKLGRGLFRVHGTGEAPNFFSSHDRYPQSSDWNPALGCLSARELYDETTGQLLQADMPKILDRLSALGGNSFTGYLIVVEIPGEGSIELADLEALLKFQP